MTRAPALRIPMWIAVVALVVTACSGTTTSPAASTGASAPPAFVATPAPSAAAAASATPVPAASIDTSPVTIKVWDYYGDTTPIKPALNGFRAQYPFITVDYQALDWDSMNEKFK